VVKLKKMLLMLTIAVFCLYSSVGAEEINVEVGAETSQQMYGGTQSITFNSAATDEIIYRSYIQPHAGTEFLFAPRVIYIPDEARPWHEIPYFKYEELYAEKELDCFMKRDGDIVQFTAFGRTVRGLVEWDDDDGLPGFVIVDTDGSGTIWDFMYDDLTVIGNRHDNPELMEPIT